MRDATMHLDIMTTESLGVCISISTRFKHTKHRRINVSLPMSLNAERWTVVAVDMSTIVKDATKHDFKYLRGITLGANMYVRGVYTSDNMYAPSTLPTKVQFPRLDSSETWEDLYDMTWVPRIPKQASERRIPLRPAAISCPRPSAARTDGDVENKTVVRAPALPRAQQSMWTDLRRLGTPPFCFANDDSETSMQEQRNSCVVRPDPILKLRKLLGFGPSSGGDSVGRGSSERTTKATSEAHVSTAPQPPSHIGPLWSTNGKEIVFASSHILVAMTVEDLSREEEGGEESTVKAGAQRFFNGHSADVGAMCLSSRGQLLASAQVGQPCIVRIWDFATTECLSMLAGAPARGVHGSLCLDFSVDGALLCVAGRDDHGRQQIVLWDVSQVFSGGTQNIVARQTSEFDVKRIYFSPFDTRRLVSCGEESVRFWRVRRRHLPAAAVVLNEYTRGTVFTDLAFESSFAAADADATAEEAGYCHPRNEPSAKTTGIGGMGRGGPGGGFVEPSDVVPHQHRRIFVASALGTVLQINYDTRGLECVFQLHDAAIHGICVNDGYCATVSGDCVLRVWPLDFSDFFLEARHDGPVCAVDISKNGCWLGVASDDGTIGIMDVVSQQYSTVMRMHRTDIRALAMSGSNQRMPRGGEGVDCSELVATISGDRTIRLWSTATMEQQYEFSTTDDVPECATFNPSNSAHMICGFRSGCLRVFDVERTKLLSEAKPHRAPILGVACSPDGSRLFTFGADNNLCSHDPADRYVAMSIQSIMPVADSNQRVAGSDQKLSDDKRAAGVQMDVTSDNTHLALAGRSIGIGRVLVYDAGDLSPVLCLHADLLHAPFSKIRFAPFNDATASVCKLVASSGRDQSIVIFTLRSESSAERVVDETEKHREIGRPRAALTLSSVLQIPCAHHNEITAMSVSHDGRFVATGGSDQLLKIWDVEMPGAPTPPFQSFVGHSSPIRDVAFSADGTAVVSVSGRQMLQWRFLGSKVASARRPEGASKQERVAASLTGHVRIKRRIDIVPDSAIATKACDDDRPVHASHESRFQNPARNLRRALRKRAITAAQVFGFMDGDRSDRLTFGEMTRGLATAGVHLASSDARALFDELDRDGNGTISWVEFVTCVDREEGPTLPSSNKSHRANRGSDTETTRNCGNNHAGERSKSVVVLDVIFGRAAAGHFESFNFDPIDCRVTGGRHGRRR
eukprot:g5262.t1